MNKNIFIFLLFISPIQLFCCSSIWLSINGYFLLGANLDSESHWDGLIFINQRDIQKSTDIYNEGDNIYQWRSKYGSVTFNLVCKEYAQYGMNEQGLIVSTVSNPQTQGQINDGRPSLFGNFWVQFILDICSTTEEVKRTLDYIRIVPGFDRYVICDRFNNKMIIEFENCEIIIYENDNLPINVLTNQPYNKCLNYFYSNKLPQKENTFDYITTKRFFVASKSLQSSNIANYESGTQWLFENLKTIEGSPESIWRIVFDQKLMKVSFITKSNKMLRSIDFNKLDFSCDSKNTLLDIDKKINGDISNFFEPYSNSANNKLYQSAMKNIGNSISKKEIAEHIQFLEKFTCKGQ